MTRKVLEIKLIRFMWFFDFSFAFWLQDFSGIRRFSSLGKFLGFFRCFSRDLLSFEVGDYGAFDLGFLAGIIDKVLKLYSLNYLKYQGRSAQVER
jgi:hypothetical protein